MRTTTIVDEAALDVLLEHIRDDRGLDLTGYQRTSLSRRIQRRIDVLGLGGCEEYHDHLALHPDEFAAMCDTVLVNVTGFFRDPAAWDYLRREVLPDLVGRREGQPIRIWDAGCSSGQESCTVAIALAEEIGEEEVRDRVTIYATDVDEGALATGRRATYAAHQVEGVPPAVLERYFDRVGRRFVLRPALRRSLVFGRHDLVRDAPISRVDLLLCRNTLMYFDARTQGHILSRLHLALQPDGVLFLGQAEMLVGHAAYFRPVEPDQRVFVKAGRAPRSSPPGGVAAVVADSVQCHPVRDERVDADRLESAYAELQSTVEELATTREVLRSTVEELEATHEELESTHHELATLNEELQAMGGELHVAHETLRERQAEVDRLTRATERSSTGRDRARRTRGAPTPR